MLVFVGRDVIPPNHEYAGCHPAPHHLLYTTTVYLLYAKLIKGFWRMLGRLRQKGRWQASKMTNKPVNEMKPFDT